MHRGIFFQKLISHRRRSHLANELRHVQGPPIFLKDILLPFLSPHISRKKRRIFLKNTAALSRRYYGGTRVLSLFLRNRLRDSLNIYPPWGPGDFYISQFFFAGNLARLRRCHDLFLKKGRNNRVRVAAGPKKVGKYEISTHVVDFF